MRTAIIGTAKGIFVVDTASGAASVAFEGPSVRHLSRVNGHCVAGSTAGLLRSADAGRSWQPSGIGDREVWDVAAAPGDPSTLYAVTEPAGLFLSRDGGASWTEIAGFRAAPGFTKWCVPVTPPRPGRARDRARPRRSAASGGGRRGRRRGVERGRRSHLDDEPSGRQPRSARHRGK